MCNSQEALGLILARFQSMMVICYVGVGLAEDLQFYIL